MLDLGSFGQLGGGVFGRGQAVPLGLQETSGGGQGGRGEGCEERGRERVGERGKRDLALFKRDSM